MEQTLTDRIVVEADTQEPVNLTLNGVTSKTTNCAKCSKLSPLLLNLYLPEGTTSVLSSVTIFLNQVHAKSYIGGT